MGQVLPFVRKWKYGREMVSMRRSWLLVLVSACASLSCAMGQDLPDSGRGRDTGAEATVDAAECRPGESRVCYSGAAGTMDQGRCRPGTQSCNTDAMWGTCVGEVVPAGSETCSNSVDDNCDGATDENCGDCEPAAMRDCYSGAAATRNVGPCRGGTQVCSPQRMWGSQCIGEVVPAASETCGNTIDDNCNGMVDENCGECTPGAMRSCYTGTPSTTMNVGPCRGGQQVCSPQRMWGTQCIGEVVPATSDTCANSIDDNCNGMTDENCGVCTPGTSRTCYTGTTATRNVGICRDGMQTCTAARDWPTTCTGQVLPAASETCGNSLDDNCNGSTDEGCVTRPANDVRTSAVSVTLSDAEVTQTGTTVGATLDGPTPCACTTGGNIWYTFTTTQTVMFYADTAGSAVDTVLLLTNSAGTLVAGMCNDNASCNTGGFTNVNQSRIYTSLAAGTYYVSVGSCAPGAVTLHMQQIRDNVGTYVYSTPLTGMGTTSPTSPILSSVATGSCGGTSGGEDVRWFVTCGAQTQFFSLCSSDGGSFVRGTQSYDPVLYLRSAQSNMETACNDDGGSMGGTACAGTGGDTSMYGSRLNNITMPRGLGAVFIDTRNGGSGMTYTMNYVIR